MNKLKQQTEEVLQKLNPRFMASDPWRSIDASLDSLVDKIVLEMNPQTLDDDIEDVLNEWDNRENAIDYLIEKLQKMKDEV